MIWYSPELDKLFYVQLTHITTEDVPVEYYEIRSGCGIVTEEEVNSVAWYMIGYL